MDWVDDCIHYAKEGLYIAILFSIAIIVSKWALISLGLVGW